MNIQTYTHLKFVPFHTLDQWDIKRYYRKEIDSSFPMVRLGDYIQEESKKYSINEKDTKYGILGVNNQTGIFDAYEASGADIHQKYKKMQVGWIAYNPYRVNVGSIGIRKQEHHYEYISPAYVVFSCKQDLLPEYLFMVLKTSIFNKIICENTTGSVRQNLSYSILSNLQIPLPSFKEQKVLVKEYNAIVNYSYTRFSEGLIKAREAQAFLSHSIGIQERFPNGACGEFTTFEIVSYKKIQEWGTDKILCSRVYQSSKYDTKTLEGDSSLYDTIMRGKSPAYDKTSTQYMLNQKCIRWNNIDTQYAKTVSANWLQSVNKECLTQEGDVLINSTGEGTIGRASVVTKPHEGLLYDSHVLLLRLNKEKIDPRYFTLVFNSRYGQEQVNNVKSAKTTKQTELGIENLKKIQIPIPPLNTQREIVAKLYAMYEEIADLQNTIPYQEKATKQFEQIIFA